MGASVNLPNLIKELDRSTEHDHDPEMPHGPLFGLLSDAVEKNASDIHISANGESTDIHFRINGKIENFGTVPENAGRRIVGQIKTFGELPPGRVLHPVNTRISAKTVRGTIDTRVCLAPSINGTMVSIRIPREEQSTSIEGLGFDSEVLRQLRNWSEHAGGMLLVSGPTGAGKTTTFYSLCSELSRGGERVITIEDPVERTILSLDQITCGQEKQLNFPNAIRSVLRLDPDVIGVGEIRDSESAHAAVQASLSGQKVVATIHATSPFSVVSLMRHWGLASYEIAASLGASLNQRLVRKLCDECKKATGVQDELVTMFNLFDIKKPDEVYEPVGCELCHGTGYSQRVPIAQFWEISQGQQDAILTGAEEPKLRGETNRTRDAFMTNGLQMIADGTTTLQEIRRWLPMNSEKTTS